MNFQGKIIRLDYTVSQCQAKTPSELTLKYSEAQKNKGRYSQNVGNKVRPKYYNLFQ